MKKIYKIIFVAIIVLLIPIFYILKYAINGEVEINYLENRKNAKFGDLISTNFMDSSFQNRLDDILIDQFPNGESIKTMYVNIINYNKPFRTIASLISGNNVRYEISDEIYTMDDDNYLMWQEYGYGLFCANSDGLIDYINNEIKTPKKYLYLINDSRTLKDGTGECNREYYELLSNELKGVNLSQLEINNINDYKYYFYKSDHHWNLYGSYEGYKDIIKLLLDDDKVIIPNEQVKLGDNYCGSFCRLIGYFDSREPFYIYDYNYSDMKCYINGQLEKYGHEEDYIYKKWPLNENENYYGAVYGGNYGEIIFDTGQQNKENLLVLSSSFINPISKLLASHFNKTYIVDIRYYEEDQAKIFDINEYNEINKIDKVMIVGDIDTLITINKWTKEKDK